MNDRGMIKWQPFNSVINTRKLVDNLEEKRNLVQRPILSEEQLDEINNKIFYAYYNKTKVSIKYYLGGHIYTKEGQINKIHIEQKYILLGNHIIYFAQILSVKC